MTMRTRKLFGTIALLVLVVVWSLMGMTLAQTPPPNAGVDQPRVNLLLSSSASASSAGRALRRIEVACS